MIMWSNRAVKAGVMQLPHRQCLHSDILLHFITKCPYISFFPLFSRCPPVHCVSVGWDQEARAAEIPHTINISECIETDEKSSLS